MAGLLQDIRYGLRAMRKAPGFSATTIVTLALAIGVTTAVFSVIDAVLIRPLPYDHPERILYLRTNSPQGYTQPAAYPEYLDWRRENQVFSALAGYSHGSANFEGPAGPVGLPNVSTTDSFFDVFRVQPLLGRTFAQGEDQPGKNDVAVLSYELWEQAFGKQNSAIGKTVKLDGRPYTVIGVMPAGFRYPVSMRSAIYTPLHIPKDLAEERRAHWMPVLARLKPGVSRAQAQAGMNRVMDDLGRAFPDTQGRWMELFEISNIVVGNTEQPLKVLVFAVLTLLAIGCVNVAGLLLARGVKREREVALRSAVGAGRWRIVRQMLTETLLLAIAGAAGGTLLAYGLLNLTRKLLVSALARGADVQVNGAALVVALALAVATSLLAGLAPALRLSGTAPTRALKTGGSAGASRGQHRLRGAFIVTQIALALVLVVVSGLLLRALTRLRGTDLGFNPDGLLAVEIDLSTGSYENRDVVTNFYQPLLDRVREIPGIKEAGLIQMLPIQDSWNNSDIHIVGHPPNPPNEERIAEQRILTPGYFQALGVSLVRGRMLDEKIDTPTSPSVVVVNEAFVKKFFSEDEDPIGQHIDDKEKTTIVGVVRSVRQVIYQPPMAEMDAAVSQVAAKDSLAQLGTMQLVVRTSGSAEAVVPGLRQGFHELDPGLPFRQPLTMHEVVADALVFERLETWLFGAFAAFAVLLAVVGLYGLISHEVELSTHDIGVRVALGSTRFGVLAAIYRRVGLMLLSGVTVGLALTWAARKLVASMVVIQVGKDAGVIVGLAAGLLAAGLLAVLIPARRAASVDPMVALRYE
ncbi:MAG: ABC transporter permease [Candidatus Sulfotelmatobacter sp.]